MSKIQQAKTKLRREIATIKKKYTFEELCVKSEEVLSVVELTGIFQEAKTVFIYNSMADEVQTKGLLERWVDKKDFYLPVVKNDNIVFRKYTPEVALTESLYGIMEPVGNDFTDFRKVDLIIVPGLAFDRKMNRLGYGKGYYDRFLASLKIPRMGICFDFQLFDQIPADINDIKMDYLISENDLIW